MPVEGADDLSEQRLSCLNDRVRDLRALMKASTRREFADTGYPFLCYGNPFGPDSRHLCVTARGESDHRPLRVKLCAVDGRTFLFLEDTRISSVSLFLNVDEAVHSAGRMPSVLGVELCDTSSDLYPVALAPIAVDERASFPRGANEIVEVDSSNGRGMMGFLDTMLMVLEKGEARIGSVVIRNAPETLL
jgi:hypothetical protein